MPIEIIARGENLRYVEPNAATLGLEDPERVTPDPVDLWCRFVGRGFADRGDQAAHRPSVQLVRRLFDSQREVQHWELAAARLDPGLLRVLGNLLRADKHTKH